MSPTKSVKRGKLNGSYREFYSNGKIKISEIYKKGLRHGWSREWYCDGQLKRETGFINGSLEGHQRVWYPGGNLQSDYAFQRNQLHGAFTEWWPNGQCRETGTYVQGRRHGLFEEFDEAGRRKLRQIYLNGEALTGKIQRRVKQGTLKPADLERLACVALRRMLVDIYGISWLVNGLEKIVLDVDQDNRLLMCRWHEDEEPVVCVQVRCPSTGVYYTLRVPPHTQTVHEGVAWTFSLTDSEYDPIYET